MNSTDHYMNRQTRPPAHADRPRARELLLLTALLVTALPSHAQEAPAIDPSVVSALQGKAAAAGVESSRILNKLGQRLPAEDGQTQSEQDKGVELGATEQFGETSGGSKELSVYEQLVRGLVVQPDDILSSLHVYGHEIFARPGVAGQTSSDNVSVPGDYPVAPGDEILLMTWGRINEEHRIVVDRDGRANVPRVGPVPVAGLPFDVMQKNVVDRVESIEGVRAAVTMGRLRSIQVFIVGEVARPGQYTLSALTSPTNALFAAGGLTKRGSLRSVQLVRNGRTVTTLDFYDFLMAGNSFSTIRLKSGDVLFVPVVKKMAAVAGNVRRSALYEFTDNTDLADLIELAGGLTAASWLNRIQVERFLANQYQVVLDIETPDPSALPGFRIHDADIVKVFPILIRDQNAVYLSGNVMRPGKYEHKVGMRVSDLLPSTQMLLPETYFDYAVIKRKVAPSYADRLLSFDLGKVLQKPGGPNDLVLRPQDELIVYHRDFFEPVRTVLLQGAVNAPRSYKLLENMRVKDLLLEGGGLTEHASDQRGELYRREFEGDTVTTQKIPFCVSCAMTEDSSHNLLLQKDDRVYIRPKAGWEEVRTVVLQGEVVFPGAYVILSGETLAEVVERAGGFTEDAHLEAAVFTRPSVKAREERRNKEYIRHLESDMIKVSMELASKENAAEAAIVMNQQAALIERLRDLESSGRVVVDLTDRASYEGFALEDGDGLTVPKRLNTVSVLGEVYNPSTFQLDGRDRRVKHYVDLAGGLKRGAESRRSYVVLANGSVVTRRARRLMRYDLSAGDAIVVPPKIRYVSGYRIFMDTIDAIYKVAITAGVIVALTK